MSPRKSSKSLKAKAKDDAFDFALASAQMAEVQRLAAAHTRDAIRSLVEIATATERELEPDEDGYFRVLMEEFEDEAGQLIRQPIRKPYLPGPRSTAAKALLEHAHGRPNQRIPQAGSGADTRITVVLQTFGKDGEPTVIDVTPTPDRLAGGEDTPPEQMDA